MTRLIFALSGNPQHTIADTVLRGQMRRMAGSGILVAVGYIDPGNWATDIAGGSGFGYGLLSIVLLSAILAMGFQVLAARVAVATGRDLAQLTAAELSRPFARLAWLAGEAAILATALAELIGGAIALRLLFGLPLMAGVAITGVGTFLVFYLTRGQTERHERVIAVLLAIVALSFVFLLLEARPSWLAMGTGITQTGRALSHTEGFMIALGILGATLMPHNLYLHSGTLAERARQLPPHARPLAYTVARNDTIVSLGIAMLINAAIMIVAAASMSGSGPAIASLDGAHAAIGQSLGAAAAIVFAVALYAAGQSSTITGVMAGRMLSAGFNPGRGLSDPGRAAVTRVVAAVAAMLLLGLSSGQDPDQWLVLSQVVLSLALPFALVPLVLLACRRSVMGERVLHPAWATAAVAATAGIIVLDLYLVADALI